MATKQNNSYTEVDYYKSYMNYIGTNKKYAIDYKLFSSILYDYFKIISDSIILKAADVKLPSQLGTIFVRKRKFKPYRRNLNVDFKSTNELGKTVLHMNEHTNGYSFMFKWEKRNMAFRASTLYQLVMSRDNKRRLAKCIKNKTTDYIEL